MSYDVLVVDDSGVTRSMVIKSLSIAKIPVRTCFEAADGREALEIMEDHWVDLVLADLNMPIMGGQELLKIMRGSRQLADVPVIVVTSENRDPVQLTEWWTAAAYVRKPFTPEEIRAAFGALVPAGPEPPEQDQLFQRFASILESVTYMSAEALPAGQRPSAPGDFFRARLSFSGGALGVLSLTVPRLLAAQMAANALGIEPDDPVALNHDADMVGELLNIACGHVLDVIAEGKDVQLEPPVIIRHDASKWDELARDPVKMWCLVEGQPVMLGLAMRAGQ
jgi:two-component system, chemotaxis family, chemotaxis protein CheY